MEWRAGGVPQTGDRSVSAEQWQEVGPEEGPMKSKAFMFL